MIRRIVLGAVVAMAVTVIISWQEAPQADEGADAAVAALAEIMAQGQLAMIWRGNQLPNGWELCEGMSGKFPYGVSSIVNVGQSGGSANHTHPALAESKFTPSGPTDAMIGGRTGDASEGLPPYVKVAFICLSQ